MSNTWREQLIRQNIHSICKHKYNSIVPHMTYTDTTNIMLIRIHFEWEMRAVNHDRRATEGGNEDMDN